MAYTDNRADREAVKERDGHQCLFCEETSEEHQAEFGRGLYVTQIIPRSDGGEYKEENLTTLCQDCHNKLYHLHSRAVAQIYPNDELDHRQTVEAVGDSVQDLAEFRDETLAHAASFGQMPEIEDYSIPEWRLEEMSDWEYALFHVGGVSGMHAAVEHLSETLDEGLDAEDTGS